MTMLSLPFVKSQHEGQTSPPIQFKMNRVLVVCLTFFFMVSGISSYAQSDNCSPATTYPTLCAPVNGTNVGATTGPEDSYAAADICALSVENTVWYTFTAPATDVYTITMTIGACAPFNSGLQVGVLTGPCGGPYTGINCSFMAANGTSNFTFNGVVGQQYWIVVDGDGGDECPFDIQIGPSAGCTCSITSFTSVVGACDPGTDTFDITGVIEFVAPPGAGTLIVEDCNGNQQTFAAPFTSPQNYSITGIAADGAACDVTVYFSADPTCTQTINHTNPAPCACDADAGSW